MKRILIIALAALLVFGCKQNKKPNVIVIFTDDHGYSDLGIQELQDDIKTPNIDQLAKEGVVITNGYVTAPQCTPSRAGLLTGRYQQRFGLYHNGTIPLPLDETLIPQYLIPAGYMTGMTGKWHLEPNSVTQDWLKEYLPEVELVNGRCQPSDVPFSKKLPYMPSERGFLDTYKGEMHSWWINYNLEGETVEKQMIVDKRFRIDVQTDAAVTFIDRNHDKPFFFYLAYYGPHVPLEATQKYLDRFPGEMPERRRYALAMISAIDDGVGRVKEALKKYKIDDNTLIFLISDNGATLKIDKKDLPISFQGGAWDGSLNDPLNGEKGMISEGGIRVPFVVSWPGKIPGGQVYTKPVSSLDVAATALALSGQEIPKKFDGVNIVPYLTGENEGEPHDYLYWRFWDQIAVRHGNLKYLRAGSREYLFDVKNDKEETKNIIDLHPEEAKQMKLKLENWVKELKNPYMPDSVMKKERNWYNHYFEGLAEDKVID